MIDGIYNYLIPTYVPKTSSHANIHKRSELKTVYNKIIDKGKRSPLYLVDFSPDKQQFALGIKDAALALNSNLNRLQGEESSSFAWKKVSTDSSSVTASIISDDYEKLPERFSIQVNKMASAQKNTGTALYSTGKGPKEGVYVFSIETNGQMHEYQFNIGNGVKNIETADKLAQFINQNKLGINASVFQDTSKNVLHLDLQTDITGRRSPSPFYLKDISTPSPETPGIVEFYGLNHMTTPASNAEFVIDKEERNSYSNEFIINQALNVSLNYPSTKSVAITYQPDSSKILNEIGSFCNDYNEMIDLAQNHTKQQHLSGKLLREMKKITSAYRNELEAAGITFTLKGQMKIDDALATQAIQDGDLQDIFENPQGFSDSLSNKISDISIDPLEYIEKKLVTYPNISKPGTANPYMTSIYSGILFNYYC